MRLKNLTPQILRSLSLSLGLVMTSGCAHYCALLEKEKEPSEVVIVVEKSDITENEDGSFTVSKDWMLLRMSQEEELLIALELCIEGIQE